MEDEAIERQSRRRSRKQLAAWLAAVVLLLVILLLLLCYCRPPVSVSALHPLDRVPTLNLGDAVVTGFSGVVPPDPAKPMPAGKAATDQTFIDVNGPSARIFDPQKPDFVWNGDFWAAPYKRDIPARAVGQVFGIAIDNLAYPDIYLTATSVFGLNIVAPDSDGDGLPERLKTGQTTAGWAPGQFGPGGGPGSIWKVDGRSGEISLFAEVTLGGRTSGPAALGNIAYDAGHRQLFVSDLSTGMIHRFGLDGTDLGHFDHGATGRAAARLPKRPHDPAALADIGSATFDTEDPATWGFTHAERRVWGLALHEGRLYYAVAAGRIAPAEAGEPEADANANADSGQIWSVGLDQDGDFANDPRLEISLPGSSNDAPISDIVFAHDGAMIVAQRAVIGTTYGYDALKARSVAHVNRFWREKPNDPKTPSAWYQAPEEYAVGYAGDSRNGAGGVSLGYGYDAAGEIDLTACEDAIFLTGDMLRDFKQQKDQFIAGGPLNAHGLQISPKGPVRGFNVPPSISYFVNYTDQMSTAKTAGTVGDVEVYRLGCAVGACGVLPAGGVVTLPKSDPPATVTDLPENPDFPEGECIGADCVPSCVGPDCLPPCIGPDCVPPCIGPDCEPPCVGPDCISCFGPDCLTEEPELCMKVSGEAICDPEAGGWIFKIVTQDIAGIGMDTLTAYSSTPGVTVSNGPVIPVVPPPGLISLSGATPGQTVAIDVCGFDDAARLTGEPYDCCRATLTVKVPEEICRPAEGEGMGQ